MKLTVNGDEREVEAEADTPLLWVLRDHLQLCGTKFGCGIAQCGACTVHVDGTPVRSCIVSLAEVEGRKVTTIEGLGERGAKALHVVQRAWLAENVPQCGYCQSGQIMSACALLAANPKPTDEDIDSVMAGNLCRCGTYPRIRRAIHRVVDELAKDPPAQPAQAAHAGQPAPPAQKGRTP